VYVVKGKIGMGGYRRGTLDLTSICSR